MSHPRTTSFDGWVLRIDLGELVKEGRKIRLQDQPLQILDELLSRPGELVTREQLIARLWPTGVVDFDTGLNSAVRKLRVALQDEAETPRYIETVPRRGYRFIGAIDSPEAEPAPIPPPQRVAVSVSTASTGESSATAGQPSPDPRSRRTYTYVAVGVAVLMLAGLIFGLRREAAPTTQVPAAAPQPVSLDSPTIAVLPFRAATPGEANEVLALVVTDLVRNRLATFKDIVVIAGGSTARMADAHLDARETGRKLNARFLLHGSAARAGDQIRTEVELVDAASGAQLWSTSFDSSVRDAAALREGIVERVASTLHVPAEPVSNAMAPAAINLEAHQLYVRGQQLLSTQRLDDANAAVELFRRATILDPSFARGYLALAQAQLLTGDLTDQYSPELLTEVNKSLDRALELDPALGEAWIERALLAQGFARDAVKAEALYRKGLALAPSYGEGYADFSRFLFSQYRKGEAIEMIDRARQIDPLTPDLHLRQAFLLMVSHSDVAAHDRLLREALAINPGFRPALLQLANSNYEYSDEFAEAIRLLEQAIALDPAGEGRSLAATVYLDLDDPVAAMAVLGKTPDYEAAEVKIAQYQRDRRRAAELARSLAVQWQTGPIAPVAEALRDDAIATGDYAPALKLLEARYSMMAGTGPRMWSRGLGLVYAHTLVLAGEAQRGRKLATSILVQLEAESVGRTENWFCRERAAAFAILGDDELALAELAIAQKMKKLYRWWYLAELDPLYEHLRSDPRFQELAERASKHRVEQRALVEQMRRKGEVPKRT
jgi:TolB-like protein/DNA-binding winged helix-turn-helix (wHTH) protein/Tfp pilus assembly protein PilF